MPKKKSRIRVVKVIEPEAILEREIAEEDRDLRRAKVAEIFAGFRNDREKRREELKGLMNDLRMQRIRRREATQKFMLNLREKVWAKKKMMPEVRV